MEPSWTRRTPRGSWMSRDPLGADRAPHPSRSAVLRCEPYAGPCSASEGRPNAPRPRRKSCGSRAVKWPHRMAAGWVRATLARPSALPHAGSRFASASFPCAEAALHPTGSSEVIFKLPRFLFLSFACNHPPDVGTTSVEASKKEGPPWQRVGSQISCWALELVVL